MQIIDIKEKDSNKRIDIFLKEKTKLSRSYISKLLNQKHILCNHKQIKSSYMLKTKDRIYIELPEIKKIDVIPVKGDLDILYEDKNIIVISKKPNLVVHHGAGVKEPTLVNFLLYHCKDLSGIGGQLRPGIVHRLDKETSGVMIIAKNDESHISISNQFARREVKKTYQAIISGKIKNFEGVISSNIGRDKKNRKKISSNTSSPKEAITSWKKISEYNNFSFIEAYPKTGRTHQIRVHFASIGHPIIGDKVYSTKDSTNNSKKIKSFFNRHMLHANKIEFYHPIKNKKISFESELPEDMSLTLKFLEDNYE